MEMKVDSKRVREVRMARAWSQEHLAEVSGLGLRTIQRIENGSNASLESVAALSSVLNIPIVELVVQQEQKRTFVDVLADNRLLGIPVLVFIGMIFNPPQMTSQMITVSALWVALEVFLALAKRKKSRA